MQHNFELVKEQIDLLLREIYAIKEAKQGILSVVTKTSLSITTKNHLNDCDTAVRLLTSKVYSMFDKYTLEVIEKYNSGHITQLELIEALQWDAIYLKADHLQGVFTNG